MFQGFIVDTPSSLSNARPSKCSLKNTLAAMFICIVSWEIFDVQLRCQNSQDGVCGRVFNHSELFRVSSLSIVLTRKVPIRATKMNQVIATKNASGV